VAPPQVLYYTILALPSSLIQQLYQLFQALAATTTTNNTTTTTTNTTTTNTRQVNLFAWTLGLSICGVSTRQPLGSWITIPTHE